MKNGKVDYTGNTISMISILFLIVHCLSGMLSSLVNMLMIGGRRKKFSLSHPVNMVLQKEIFVNLG